MGGMCVPRNPDWGPLPDGGTFPDGGMEMSGDGGGCCSVAPGATTDRAPFALFGLMAALVLWRRRRQ